MHSHTTDAEIERQQFVRHMIDNCALILHGFSHTHCYDLIVFVGAFLRSRLDLIVQMWYFNELPFLQLKAQLYSKLFSIYSNLSEVLGWHCYKTNGYLNLNKWVAFCKLLEKLSVSFFGGGFASPENRGPFHV